MALTLPSSLLPNTGLFMADATRPGVQFMLAQPWFPGLSQDMQARIMDAVYTHQASKGETLLHAGEEVRGWYAVLTGLVKLQSQTAPGRRQGYLGIPGGEWFGEGSVMKKEPRRYDVIALRDSELLCLPRNLFEELHERDLAFNRSLAHHLNMRLGQAMLIIETMRLRTPQQRVAMYLSPMLWHGSRRVNLTQEELGVLSGLSRQTVNAVVNDFDRRGLVALDLGRIEIRNEAGLLAIVWPPAEGGTAPRK